MDKALTYGTGDRGLIPPLLTRYVTVGKSLPLSAPPTVVMSSQIVNSVSHYVYCHPSALQSGSRCLGTSEGEISVSCFLYSLYTSPGTEVVTNGMQPILSFSKLSPSNNTLFLRRTLPQQQALLRLRERTDFPAACRSSPKEFASQS